MSWGKVICVTQIMLVLSDMKDYCVIGLSDFVACYDLVIRKDWVIWWDLV